MGLFGGKDEDELRASGSQTTARVTYVDDTGKRREGGTQAKLKIQLKIDSGSARGRDLDKAKWVPVTRMPHVGETVSIRFDPDDVDDWAWGDPAMYAPGSPATTQPARPGVPPPTAAPGRPADPMVEFIQNASGAWGQVPGFKQMIESAMTAGYVTIDQSSQVIDARNNPQLREQILGALRAQGIDVEAMQQGGDPFGGTFNPPQTGSPAGAPPPPPPAGSEPTESLTERLRRADALLEQGLVSADEHRALRQRIIDSI